MSNWKAKRFWTSAKVQTVGDGYTVELDGRPVRTPAKALLALPTQAMAEAVCQEWEAQTDEVRPDQMPVTRSANSAIDKVSVSKDAVVEMLAEYGDSDLLCYRATSPEGLIARQAANWDPVLDWAAQHLGARLTIASGVMHIGQPRDALQRLREEVETFDRFALAGLHDLVSLSGSLVLGLAVCRNHLTADEAWHLSRIDEDWQIEQWGEDDEATAVEAIKRASFLDAERFYRLSLT